MKIGSKMLWVFRVLLCMIGIISVVPAMAQETKVDLALRLIPTGYKYEIEVGKDNKSFLEIRNTGNKGVSNIRLSADKPEGWIVEFNPEKINYLGAGGAQTVDVIIRTAEKVSDEGYRISFIAEADEIRKVSSVTVIVKTATRIWIWVGAGIGVVVIAAFVFLFLRFGRK